MSKKVVLWVIAGLVVLVGLGPIFVAKVADRMFKMPKQLSSGAMKIKATGKISEVEGNLVLTTPKGVNRYVLSGPQSQGLKQFAGKDLPVYVFGTLMKSKVNKIQDKVVRAAIDIVAYDTKDFTVGKSMSAQVAESIRQKIKDKAEFRQTVLKKLGKKAETDVVSGKLQTVPCFNRRTSKQTIGLVVIDKYGDLYVLQDDGGLKFPVEDYRALGNSALDVVATGEVSLPNPDILVLGGVSDMVPFAVNGIYNNNDELSELIVKK